VNSFKEAWKSEKNKINVKTWAAARSIAGLRRSDHITVRTVTLASLHWLCAPERITFKLAVIVYRALHGTAARYLSGQLHRVADMPSRSRLRSASSNRLDIRPSRLVTVGNRSFASVCGTVSLKTSHLLHRCQCFDVNWRLTCFGTRTQTLWFLEVSFYYRPL